MKPVAEAGLLAVAETDLMLPAAELVPRLLRGERCVRYAACVSPGLFTVEVRTRFRLCRSANWQYWYAFGPCLLSAAFGWWALPFGPLFTLKALWINLNGGDDQTEAIIREYYITAEDCSR